MENIIQNKDFWLAVATILFVISEALAQIPTIKANSIFDLIVTILRKILNKP